MKKTTGDARIRRTMKQLKKSLICLLSEKQISEITIKELCDTAGITRQTFYLRFDDLDQCILYVSNIILEDLREKINVQPPLRGMNGMDMTDHNIFIHLFEHILDNQAFYESLLVNNTDSPFAKGFKSELYHFVKEGVTMVSPDESKLSAPKEMITVFTTAAFFDVIIWWIENHYPYSKQEMAKTLLRLSVNGPYQ
ncbi:TetR/AcrR family transcriptional regulator [Virgibacillus salexigens]|uniref:TetR family transcriptional regulator n=2 Tax=Virgibacillus TaxID=84406 RepID=A0ABQ2DME6_9BACI|nr:MULTISPECIES: TetR-like C-terminal domain-containing protein [Virgibacillus]MYL43198.1 hypothetical protein [Virgibacillus massiliensis]GGJ64163.1 TetR family transcriptional regulator [Virgibacillus kapii]CDQ41671.1 putative dihydroxyacetone kinase regulator [Virgibacillus massiliensis]